jgi:hypothetical protein
VQLADLKRAVPGFEGLSHPERIKVFAWWQHTHGGRERVDPDSIRSCYDKLAIDAGPNLARDMVRLAERKELLKDGTGYRLAGSVRDAFDKKYGNAPSTIAVEKLLADLPAKIPDAAESAFLREALDCYRVKAFRSAIVMAWNLGYSHLLRWLLADAGRLQTFNTRIPIRYAKKKDVQITKFEDFGEELKEFEVIAIASSAGLLSGGVDTVLDKELKRRNNAAHPSTVIFGQHQADDAITDLVNNVVLKLK